MIVVRGWPVPALLFTDAHAADVAVRKRRATPARRRALRLIERLRIIGILGKRVDPTAADGGGRVRMAYGSSGREEGSSRRVLPSAISHQLARAAGDCLAGDYFSIAALLR
jgi:hypothetical protein